MDLFNLYFNIGSFPYLLKLSKDIPIFKNKGFPYDVQNYRPISVLSNINKLVEKHMLDSDFLNNSKSYISCQFGFQSKRFTEYTFISLMANMHKALDCCQFACGVFIDLQKAFNTVDHYIRIHKRNHYGVRGVSNQCTVV